MRVIVVAGAGEQEIATHPQSFVRVPADQDWKTTANGTVAFVSRQARAGQEGLHGRRACLAILAERRMISGNPENCICGPLPEPVNDNCPVCGDLAEDLGEPDPYDPGPGGPVLMPADT